MLKVIVPVLNSEDRTDRKLATFLEKKREINKNWNSLRDKSGRQIKQKLEDAFHNKCAYCEDNQGATVDHFWPKSVPKPPNNSNVCWDYANFVLSCTGCQSAKLTQLPKNDDDMWMVNPRSDDPMLYLYIDLKTGAIAPTGPESGRGQLTIQRLKLDERGEKFNMNGARLIKYLDVFHYIKMVVDFHDADLPRSQEAWEHLCSHLSPANSYLAIIRQFLLDTPPGLIPLLESLRRIHPEFDELIEEWCLPKPENV
ncbi:MAG: hypothetical protein NTW32_00300 [Chloroflexi bacterium]|nr:hypothetical protein [Chloroflexota bacterium]